MQPERKLKKAKIDVAGERIALLERMLADAHDRLAGFIGFDCECDNTHENNGVTCALCQYAAVLGAKPWTE